MQTWQRTGCTGAFEGLHGCAHVPSTLEGLLGCAHVHSTLEGLHGCADVQSTVEGMHGCAHVHSILEGLHSCARVQSTLEGLLGCAHVHSTLCAGEKLIEHLKKWLDTTKLLETPHSWEPGQESEIAAAILELFHLLPAQAAKFLETQGVSAF